MPVFRYQGLSAAGKSVNGTGEAANEAGAYRLLTGDGITPIALETGVAQEGPKPGGRRGTAVVCCVVGGRPRSGQRVGGRRDRSL